jgi:hypothetical protein
MLRHFARHFPLDASGSARRVVYPKKLRSGIADKQRQAVFKVVAFARSRRIRMNFTKTLNRGFGRALFSATLVALGSSISAGQDPVVDEDFKHEPATSTAIPNRWVTATPIAGNRVYLHTAPLGWQRTIVQHELLDVGGTTLGTYVANSIGLPTDDHNAVARYARWQLGDGMGAFHAKCRWKAFGYFRHPERL